MSLRLFNIDLWKRSLPCVLDSLDVVFLIYDVYHGLTELIEMNSKVKNSKLPASWRFCLAQLTSEVSGTKETLPPRPVVKSNQIHDRFVTNILCVSNGCYLDSRDYDTYWTDKEIFGVA